MINIYMTKDGEVYFYITEQWFSSNFHSLEQLADVGFDDPDKRATFKDEYPHLNASCFADIYFVTSTPSFDMLNETHYPELFI